MTPNTFPQGPLRNEYPALADQTPSDETSRLLVIELSRQCANSLAKVAEGALRFAEVPVSGKEGAELMTAPTAFAVHLVMLGFRIPA